MADQPYVSTPVPQPAADDPWVGFQRRLLPAALLAPVTQTITGTMVGAHTFDTTPEVRGIMVGVHTFDLGSFSVSVSGSMASTSIFTAIGDLANGRYRR